MRESSWDILFKITMLVSMVTIVVAAYLGVPDKPADVSTPEKLAEQLHAIRGLCYITLVVTIIGNLFPSVSKRD